MARGLHYGVGGARRVRVVWFLRLAPPGAQASGLAFLRIGKQDFWSAQVRQVRRHDAGGRDGQLKLLPMLSSSSSVAVETVVRLSQN